MHGLWSSLKGVILIPAYALSYEKRTALESPEFAQNIVFLSNKTDTHVEPLNYVSNFYFAKSSWTYINALCSYFGILLYI